MGGQLWGPTGVLPSGGGGGFVGPGDIVTSGALAFWGLRAFSAAKATSAVNCIDIVDIGSANGSTLAVQANGDLNVTAIASGTLAGSSLATWISAHGTPFVHKIYDQVGNLDVTSTISTGATLVQNLYGTRPGIQTSGGVKYLSTNTLTQAQPYTLTSVSKRTSATSGNDGILGTASPFPLLIGYYSVANTLEMFGGTTNGQVNPATEGVGHAVQWLFNGASSLANVDGTDIAASPNPGSSTITASVIGLFERAGGAFAGGDIEEVGMWSGLTPSGGANGYLQLQANQKAYWGTP
jgi:hypothetical protein